MIKRLKFKKKMQNSNENGNWNDPSFLKEVENFKRV